MIILPAEQELDWRRPPVITILLILINTIVFFGYQASDDERYYTALDYYFESGLLDREARIYLEYVEALEGPEQKQALLVYAEENSLKALGEIISTDLAFTAYMRESKPDLWDEDRETFTALQHKVSYIAFGFVPAEPTIQGFFGNMWLHGDFDHLLGNMLFLFVCGFALEIAFGRAWYFGLYFLAGCLASGLSYVTGMQSYIPEIGASGAVSGLMGMYVALYGMRQIQFFYWVIIFFGYFRAPALLIFPVWVGNELYGYLYTDTNINYMAHLGGLLAGFAGVMASKHRYMKVDEAYVEKELTPEEVLSRKLENMWNQAGKLKLDQAWSSGLTLLKTESDNQKLLQQLYNIAKANPQSDKLHKLVNRIIATNPPNTEFEHFRLLLLEDYLSITDLPKAITKQNAVKMIAPACKHQYPELAYKFASLLMTLTRSNELDDARNKALLRVFMLQLKSKHDERVQDILDFLEEFAPESEEIGMARESLQLSAR